MKPFAESCEQNQQPILKIIETLFGSCKRVLEIGSGTGQHAVYFAARMPHLKWLTSDRAECHAGISLWLEEAGLPNLEGPITLDVAQKRWPEVPKIDAVFSANTLHIMHWHEVCALFRQLGDLLPQSALFAVYGPFNFNDSYTSSSNARFDEWLHARDPASGIRNFEDLDELAANAGLKFLSDQEMPANNRILVWRKD